ncbi:MAG: hypothetical protein KJ749_12750 [Planctomycetes bacterium]|nr:hypothetical protein [Planctomycetota bacterium]
MGAFPALHSRYDEVLEARSVPPGRRAEHRKWVWFYLHFCGKYGRRPADTGSVAPFVAELASKGQTTALQAEARCAVRYHVDHASPFTVRRSCGVPV